MSRYIALWLIAVCVGYFSGSVDGQCSLPSSPCSHCSVDGYFDGEAPVPQGSYLLWTCDIGYVIDGRWEMVVWVCVQNNTWIGPQPICTEVTCSSPPVPAHGSIVEDDQQTYHQGDNISYVCDTGYSLSFPNSTGNLTCGTDGRWIPDNAPICRIDCPESYTEHDNVCFSTLTALSDWYGAVQACAVQGDILALPKNNNTHDHLKSMVNSGNYWIGVREGRDWKWASDGSYIERLFWNQGEPNGNHESCVELRKSDDGDHFWNDAACGEQNSFICEAEGSCINGTEESSSLNATYNGKCYRFIGVSLTWQESRDACESRNYGFLVEILDLSTQEFLSSLASLWESVYSTERLWWIGASEDTNDIERSWFWSDDTRVHTTQWAPGEPNNMGAEECVEMRESLNFGWNDQGCSQVASCFCQKGLVACGDPGAPAHGVRTPDDTSSFLDGAKVHLRCDPGYQLNGSSSIMCLTNGNWDSELPECQAVACQGEPPSVNGTNVTVTENEFKALAIYECSDGLIPTASPVSYCQTDGTWSQPDFSCTVPTSSPTETSPTSVKTTGWGTSQSLSTTDMTTQPQTTNFQTTAYSLHSTKPVMSSSPTPDGVSSTKMSVTGYPLTESATTLRGTTRGEITHTSSGTDSPASPSDSLTTIIPTTEGEVSHASAKTVIAGTSAALLFLLIVLIAVFIIVKRRKRLAVKSNRREYLEKEFSDEKSLENAYSNNMSTDADGMGMVVAPKNNNPWDGFDGDEKEDKMYDNSLYGKQYYEMTNARSSVDDGGWGAFDKQPLTENDARINGKKTRHGRVDNDLYGEQAAAPAYLQLNGSES